MNSPLATKCLISPYRESPRKRDIETVIIHRYPCQESADTMLNRFHRDGKIGSYNYVIGYNGAIGLCVEERDRAMTTLTNKDHRAVTVCVSADEFSPNAITEVAEESLVNLLVDICERNEIPNLTLEPDSAHPWQYYLRRYEKIMSRVNLSIRPENPDDTTAVNQYRVRTDWSAAHTQAGLYYTLPKAKQEADRNPGYKVYNYAGICVYPPADPGREFPCKIRIAVKGLSARKGPGTNYRRAEGGPLSGEWYIDAVQNGQGSSNGWGLVQTGSISGWIPLDYCKILD